MLPASYARLAGHQSEINKVTITRVANSEVQYRRKINSYRKDMNVKINGIKREQIRLRRSMLRYSKLIRQHKLQKIEEMRKTKEPLISEAKVVSNTESETEGAFENVEEVEEKDDDDSDCEDSKGRNLSNFDIEKRNSTRNRKHKTCAVLVKQGNKKKTEKLDHDVEGGNDDSEKYNEQTSIIHLPPISEERGTQSILGTAIEEKHHSGADEQASLQERTKKKKKFGVSYSDLVKLQHRSSNTRLLVQLVDTLAYKSTSPDKRNKIPDIRDHVNFRGESPSQASAITKTANVFYPIKFGYSGESENDATANSCKQTENGDTGRVSESEADSMKRKNLLSFSSLVYRVNKFRLLQKRRQMASNLESIDQSSKRRGYRTEILSPVEAHNPQSRDVYDRESIHKIAWQSALSKIKTVHTLENIAW